MKNLYANAKTHNHAVTLISWSFDKNKKLSYWIIKNNLGTHWGEGSYARIQRGVNSMGLNNCFRTKERIL